MSGFSSVAPHCTTPTPAASASVTVVYPPLVTSRSQCGRASGRSRDSTQVTSRCWCDGPARPATSTRKPHRVSPRQAASTSSAGSARRVPCVTRARGRGSVPRSRPGGRASPWPGPGPSAPTWCRPPGCQVRGYSKPGAQPCRCSWGDRPAVSSSGSGHRPRSARAWFSWRSAGANSARWATRRTVRLRWRPDGPAIGARPVPKGGTWGSGQASGPSPKLAQPRVPASAVSPAANIRLSLSRTSTRWSRARRSRWSACSPTAPVRPSRYSARTWPRPRQAPPAGSLTWLRGTGSRTVAPWHAACWA